MILSFEFIKFSIVGILGAITNISIFFVLVDILSLPYNLIAIFTFLIAVTQNYFLNHKWTFKKNTFQKKINIKDYFKFLITCILGLSINLFVLNIALLIYSIKYKFIAQAIAILSGMIFNYLGSKFFVFKKKYN